MQYFKSLIIILFFYISTTTLLQAQDMHLSVNIAELFVPDENDTGSTIELEWRFQVRVYEVDDMETEILIEEGLTHLYRKSIEELDVNDWYSFEDPVLFENSGRPEIYNRFFDFDVNKNYGVRVKFDLYETDTGNDDLLCNQWRWNLAETFSLGTDITCGNIGEKTVTGGCGDGFYKLNIGWQVNHLTIPDHKIYCSNDLEAGIFLSEEFRYDVHGYDGSFRQHDYTGADVPQFTDVAAEISIEEPVAFLFPPNVWHWVYVWEDAAGNEVYNSYNDNNTVSYGEIAVTQAGSYTIRAGYFINYFNGIFNNNPALLNTVATVLIGREQAPILNHVGEGNSDYPYVICPGEVLALGEGYAPVNPENLVTTSPQENGFIKDGLEYYWAFFPGIAPEDGIDLNNKPRSICLGYTETMDLIQSGKYLLEITHHHQDAATGDYYFCKTEKTFGVFKKGGPDIVLEPFSEFCEGNPGYESGHVLLDAGVCPDGANCPPNSGLITRDTNRYNFDWNSGGSTAIITVNTPGIYIVTITEISSGCQATRQVEVIACNEKNYGKIVPVSLVEKLENTDTDEGGFSELRAGNRISVFDPDDCGFNAGNAEVLERKALVKLFYHRAARTDIENAEGWTLDIYYRINGELPNNLPLRINSTGEDPTFLTINEHDLNICKQSVEVRITDVVAYRGTAADNTIIPVEDLPEDIHLELEQRIVRLANLAATAPVIDPVPQPDSRHKTTVSWSVVPGALEYELMIAHEDEFMDGNAKVSTDLNPDYESFFKEYGYKIETTGNHYELDVTYPSGVLLFRVRAVGRHRDDVGENYTYRKYSDWSGVEVLGVAGFHDGTSGASGAGKNWEKSLTFAEGGKRREVVTYLDGLLRPESTVTHLNSDGTVLRAHHFYDHEGRNTFGVIPFPELNGSLSFEASGYEVQNNNNTEPLSKEHFDFGVQPQLLPSYGAAKYFSTFDNAHPFYNQQHRFPNIGYLPDANGFVSTQGVYERGGTGRMARQSGLGETFRLVAGNNPHHETRFFYGTATGGELHRLFGSNIGVADHYKKHAVLDGNGQVSISYLDMQDRVIATALAGKVPDNVVGLGNEKEAVTVNLEDNNNWNSEQNTFVTDHEIFNTTENTGYIFSYDIETVVNKMSYLFPGKRAVFEQDYFAASDIGNWLFQNGSAIIENGYLFFYENNNGGNYVARLNLSVEQNKNYTLVTRLGDLHENAVVKFINDGTATVLDLSGNELFENFIANDTMVQLEISFPNITGLEALGSLDFVRLYKAETVPVLRAELLFENEDITDDGNPDTDHIFWTGEDADGLLSPANNSFLQMKEPLGDGNNNHFETVLEVFVPNDENVPASHEILFKATRFNVAHNINFTINENSPAPLEVLNIQPFTVAPGGETIRFKWTATLPDEIINNPYPFDVHILNLNYLKIYKMVGEEHPNFFEFCEACEYEFTTYITDESGRKVALKNGGEDVFEIVRTIKSGEEDCDEIIETAPAGNSLFDLETGSAPFDSGNLLLENDAPISSDCPDCFVATFPLNVNEHEIYSLVLNNTITVTTGEHGDFNIIVNSIPLVSFYDGNYNLIPDVSIVENTINANALFGESRFLLAIRNGVLYLTLTNVSSAIQTIELSLTELTTEQSVTSILLSAAPEIRFSANFPDIGTYTIHKELKLSSEGIEAFLEGQKASHGESFLYRYIKTQLSETDPGLLCVYTCEAACIADIVNNINTENGLGETNPERLKTTNFKACIEDPACENFTDWNARFELCKEENLCNPDDLISEEIAPETVTGGCSGMLGEMKKQVSEPESFYSPTSGTGQQRAGRFYEFLYNPDGLSNITPGEEFSYIATELENIALWVNNVIEIVENNNINTESIFGYNLDNASEAIKGRFIYEHWNGAVATTEKETFLNLTGTALPEYNYISTVEDWEGWYVFYHREYVHYENCVKDIEGKTFLWEMKTRVKSWEEAAMSGFLYPLSGGEKADFPTGVLDGLTLQKETIAAGAFDSFIVENNLENRFFEDYLEEYIFALDNNTNLNLWQYLDPDGDYGCLLFAVDETRRYDQNYLDENNIYPSNINNCWPDGFQNYNEGIRWEKFVNLYAGQREKLKEDLFIEQGGVYYEDAFAIINKTSNELEEVNDLFGGELQESSCESQCNINVDNWIEGLQNYCDSNESGFTFSEIERALLETELAALCLDHCVYELLTAYLTPEDIGDLKTVLSGINIPCLQNLLQAYEATPEEEKREHPLEEIFITYVTITSVEEAANCPETCDENVSEWIAGIEQGCTLSVVDENYLIAKLGELCNNVCGRLNPSGWLYEEHEGYLTELLQNLPEGSCADVFADENLEGAEGIIDAVFLADDVLLVLGDAYYKICDTSGCLEDVVDYFWINNGNPETFVAENCDFDFIDLAEDYLTLADTANCPDGNCFSTFFWVNTGGEKVSLAPGSEIRNINYTITSPLITPDSLEGIFPAFANYCGVVNNNVNNLLENNWCNYTSSKSRYVKLSEGQEVPFISQIYDADNLPIRDNSGNNVLDGNQKYYLYPVNNELDIDDLNVLLKTVFETDRENVISFEKHSRQIAVTNTLSNGFECVNTVINLLQNNKQKRETLENCLLEKLAVHGQYLEADYLDCLIFLSTEELNGCDNILHESEFAYSLNFYNAPENLQIVGIDFTFANGNERLQVGNKSHCDNLPLGTGDCAEECTYVLGETQQVSGNDPYLKVILPEDFRNLLPSGNEYYLKGGAYGIPELEAELSAELGSDVNVYFDEFVHYNIDCTNCKNELPKPCSCYGEEQMLNRHGYQISTIRASGEAGGLLHSGTAALVNYDENNGYAIDNNVATQIEQDLQAALGNEVIFAVSLSSTAAGSNVSVSLKILHVPETVAGILLETDAGLNNLDYHENSCNSCYETLPEDCGEYLPVLLANNITVIDTTDCGEILNNYNNLIASSTTEAYSYTVYLENIPSEVAGSSMIAPLLGEDISLDTRAYKVGGSCREGDSCASPPGEKVYLYVVSFNHSESSCYDWKPDSCKTYYPPVNVLFPGESIFTAYEIPTTSTLEQDCAENWSNDIGYAAENAFEESWSELEGEMLEALADNCKEVKENFYYQHILDEYHYTLYYYDNSGSLLQTVPPEGVRPLEENSFVQGKWNGTDEPGHYLRSRYKYNSRNQAVWQNTPDGGVSRFWYNAAGQFVLSQNARQEAGNRYSFTSHDEHGRTTWVGEIDLDAVTDFATDYGPPDDPMARELFVKTALENETFPVDNSKFLTGLQQLVYTIYDRPVYAPGLVQENLRNRVSATCRLENYAAYTNWQAGIFDDINYSAYSYDEVGNVKTLLQNVSANNISHTKKINYGYDLISGNVNKVIYQKGETDQFIHRYEYDSDNRITDVYTSRDGIIEQLEAEYFYYPHGPLARVEIGNDKVQAMDYYYTLQGWIKGVNGTENNDPGQDGFASGDLNDFIAKDAFSYQLGYYKGDYNPIASTTSAQLNKTDNLWNPGATFGSDTWAAHRTDPQYKNILEGQVDPANNYNYEGLYNGNIGQMITQLPGLGEKATLYNHYQYDQLHRIKGAVGISENSNNTFTQHFQTAYNYDGMGNLQQFYRKVAGQDMDRFSYHYNYDAFHSDHLANNRLRSVSDLVPANTFSGIDIDDQQEDNYSYDNTGNLVSDAAEEIDTITWDVYGKIKEIIRIENSMLPNLEFRYDAAGNRVAKIVKPKGFLNSGDTIPHKCTFYLRDAQGNILATYDEEYFNPLDSTATENPEDRKYTLEYNIYGSSRLGILRDVSYRPPSVLATANFNGDYSWTKGRKFYELGNHLGNVMVVVSDRKVWDDSSGFYRASLVRVQDYFPFGMDLLGRSGSFGGGYRFGFNGKEDDENGFIDYGFRGYDKRGVRFLSVDPLARSFPWWSPYHFAGNTPIQALDLDGQEIYFYTFNKNYGYTQSLKTVDSWTVERETILGALFGSKFNINERINFKDVGLTFTFIHYDNTWRLVPENQLSQSLSNFSKEDWASFLTIDDIDNATLGVNNVGKKAEIATALGNLTDGIRNLAKGLKGYKVGVEPNTLSAGIPKITITRKITQAKWGAKNRYGNKEQTAIEHIKEGHFFDSRKGQKSSRFLEANSTIAKVKELTNIAVSMGKHKGTKGNYNITYTFDQVIGTTSQGKKTNTIRVYLDEVGNVINSYPVPNNIK